MKTIFYLFIILCITTVTAFGQEYAPIPDSAVRDYNVRRSFWTMDYVITVPTGDQEAFIARTSFRGISVTGAGFINDNIAIGGSFGWYGQYAEFNRSTYELLIAPGAITGRKYDYLYALPLMAHASYFFLPEATVEPFVSLGLGVQYSELETQIGSLAVRDEAWDFTFSPEAGIYVPLGLSATWGFTAKVKYNFITYETSRISNLQNWGFHLGVGFLY
ncbi:hypothetical protein [Persicobacter diffluens]|uniref:Outer membrane protein beta-barrel domain-containing protein n=1 Tax=Persicobacter diffluens TaxID=981 RepID=A0AAN4W182_9BACT|nr:hypothetical protein PEDI_44210 [Persicobacter diffluens]